MTTLREMIDELNHLIGLGLPEDTEVVFGVDMARPGSGDETKVFVAGASSVMERIVEAWREGDAIMEDLPYSQTCQAIRQGDEHVCAACGIRWGIDEEKPCTAKCS